jgi:hypothetical protein
MVNVLIWVSSHFRSGLRRRKLVGLLVSRLPKQAEVRVDARKRTPQGGAPSGSCFMAYANTPTFMDNSMSNAYHSTLSFPRPDANQTWHD